MNIRNKIYRALIDSGMPNPAKIILGRDEYLQFVSTEKVQRAIPYNFLGIEINFDDNYESRIAIRGVKPKLFKGHYIL